MKNYQFGSLIKYIYAQFYSDLAIFLENLGNHCQQYERFTTIAAYLLGVHIAASAVWRRHIN